jgi:hypothetical protein
MPQVRLQPKGLLATEAFVTIPFAGGYPLAVRSHFFEFLDDAGQAHLADELEIGAAYTLVVTTAGGLYRYRLGDRVEVTGRIARTPSLRFRGRGGSIVDRFGEKLSEAFVSSAIRETFASLGIDSPFAMLAPDQDRYTLYVQLPTPPPQQLAAALDQALRANPHYAYCCDLGQLRPLAVFPIAGDAYRAYTQALTAAGLRLGDIKPTALSPRSRWDATFAAIYPQ